MENIEITNKALTESENKQGQSVVKGTMYFVSTQQFHSELIKEQKVFNCMYQDPFELQNTKERASLVRLDIPNNIPK